MHPDRLAVARAAFAHRTGSGASRRRPGVAAALALALGTIRVMPAEPSALMPDPRATPARASELSEADAIERFGLRRRLQMYAHGERQPCVDCRVDVVEGDLVVSGDLLVDWPDDLDRFKAVRPRTAADRVATPSVGLVVTGRLVVSGAVINGNMDLGPFLLVLGETRARALYASGAEMRFEGRSRFSDAVAGYGNHAKVTFAAGLDAPLVITGAGHWFDCTDERPAIVDFNRGSVAPAAGRRAGTLGEIAARLNPAIVVDDEFSVYEQVLPRIRLGQRVVVR